MAEIGAGCRWYGERPRSALARCAVALTALAGPWEVVTAQIPCRYEVAAIIKAPDGPVGDSPTYAMAVSPNGEWVVGYYVYDAVAEPRGWYWHMPNGPFTPLPHPPGMFTSEALDVNDAGQICGTIEGDGFVFNIHTQQYTFLPPANGPSGICGATGITSSGVVCGVRTIAGGQTNGFVWSAATGFQDTGLIDGLSSGFKSISDNGHLAGWRGSAQASSNARGITGPVSAPQVLPPIPGGTTSSFTSVNAFGEICGYGRYSTAGGFDNRGMVLASNQMTLLGVLPGYRRSYAFEITDGGLVGGQCDTLESSGAYAARATVWYAGAIRDVTPIIAVPPGQLVQMESVLGIDSFGRLVGYGFANQETGTALVLDPATIAGDLSSDCSVTINDLLMVLNVWGTSEPSGDADGDGFVNINDLLVVLNNWTL